jgi:hypothetical protein
MALPTSFTLPASRAGVGSVVIIETAAKSYNAADVGVVTEGGTGSGGGGGGAPSVSTPLVFVVS